MRKTLFFIFIFSSIVINAEEIYQNFIQVYGEGPVGQHMIGFDVKEYSKEDAVTYAKKEISEFLSGMVYGYSFTYKIENKLNHSEGYFEIAALAVIKDIEKNTRLTQFEESKTALRFQALYRLTEDQKSYLKGFQSSLAKFSKGEAKKNMLGEWGIRLETYKEALKSAILNEAKSKIRARPLYIKGKILLKNSPKISLISGEWRTQVETHIIITDIQYEDVY
jgi:hypothetical protein